MQTAIISTTIVIRKATIVEITNSLIEEERITTILLDNMSIYNSICQNHCIENLDLTLKPTMLWNIVTIFTLNLLFLVISYLF